MNEEQQPRDEQQQPRDDEQQQKRRRWRLRLDGLKAEWPLSGGLTLAGTGFIAAVIVVLAWWIFQQQTQVEIPNLIGMPRAAAEAQLKDKGLTLLATYEETSDQPPGTVLRTHPPVGTKLKDGAGVSLLLAVSQASPTASQAPGTTNPFQNPFQSPFQSPAPLQNAAPAPYPAPFPVPYPNPAPAPNPAPPQPAPPPRVTLGAGQAEYDCHDDQLIFSQPISMNQPGRVIYRWLRSDQTSTLGHVDFPQPGTQTVSLPVPAEFEDELTAQIEILTPVYVPGLPISSEEASFHDSCRD